MASISATAPAAAFVRAAATRAPAIPSSPVLGLPQVGMRGGRVRCSSDQATKSTSAAKGAASVLAAASVMCASNPVLALVDERLSTEGTGLSLGISNNLLAWILIGVFALIWSLYFVYTSTLDEDEESGLSL